MENLHCTLLFCLLIQKIPSERKVARVDGNEEYKLGTTYCVDFPIDKVNVVATIEKGLIAALK